MFQFSPTSPAVTTVLLLTLTTILTVTSNQDYDEAYYQSLGPGYSYAYLQPSLTDKFLPCQSLGECAVISLNSDSQFFSYNKVNQLCKNYSPNNIMTVMKVQDSNETSFYRRSEWIKTYALSMGDNSSVYNSFTNKGTPSSWKVDKCIGNFCPNYFRHPILDFWDHLPIDEVKLVIYKNETAVVNMVFDGQHTALKNWFSRKNLKSSPWNIIYEGNAEDFSMSGYGSQFRFLVSHYSSKDCLLDQGWLRIIETYYSCRKFKPERYPTIIYSNNVTYYRPGGFQVADSMTIFIRLRPN